MSQIRLIRVFLSSPGDVTEERDKAQEVVDELTRDGEFRGRFSLELMRWDDPNVVLPMPADETPQQSVDYYLTKPSTCDLAIVIFWSRMGTKLTMDGREYLSGTHYEYEEAREGRKKNRKPQIWVYRRTQEPVIKLKDPDRRKKLDQFELVEQFFADFNDPDGQIRGGINHYELPEDFKNLFKKQFQTHLRHLRDHPEEITPKIAPSPRLQRPPYKGLQALGEGDEVIFFGRESETFEVLAKLESGRFVIITGASGSGKSSLASAGVIAHLRKRDNWYVVSFVPGTDPYFNLALGLLNGLPYWNVEATALLEKAKLLADQLKENPARLGQLLNSVLPDGKRVLLFVDQLEELFTLTHPTVAESFAEVLRNPARTMTVLVTMRADFYERAVPFFEHELRQGTYTLGKPSSIALYQMIVQPSTLAGLEWDPGLAETIVRESGDEPGVLALVAYMLEELYTRSEKRGDKRLTRKDYQELEGVQGAIGKRAEAIFATLDFEAQNALTPVFRELVEVDEHGEPTRRRAALADVARDAAAEKLVTALTAEDARLLVQDKDAEGNPTIEVAHEALLRQWSRLAAWIESEQENLRLRRQIQQAAQEWEARGRGEGYFLSRGRSEEAVRWLAVFPADDLEREFIQISAKWNIDQQLERMNLTLQSAENAQKAAEAVQRADVAERDRATRGRRAAMIAGVIGMLAILASVIAGITMINSQSTSVRVGFQATVSWLEQGNERNWLLAFGQQPTVMQTPIEIFGTATAWAEVKSDPVIESFEKVEMVQVPAGCFLMGSGYNSNEQPVAKQCFGKPFWIDRYEVTNEQFNQFNGVAVNPGDWPSLKQPRTSVSWNEARHFCELRGARLPTEAEWEYAARGPKSLAFPWGNEFILDNVVADQNSNGRTSEVGETQRPEGQSWVGAYDLSGNVWEWVSTAYDRIDLMQAFPYPYNTDDGREDLERTDVLRVVRGGSWDLPNSVNFRTAFRNWVSPEGRLNNRGFRCARSE